MPTRPLRPCTQPGCPALVAHGACAQHQRQQRRAEDRRRGSASARGYGWRWQALRASVLRDEPLCRRCAAEGRVTAAREVDHIVPRAAGGTDDRANLQPLCTPCHSSKTAGEDGGFGNARARA